MQQQEKAEDQALADSLQRLSFQHKLKDNLTQQKALRDEISDIDTQLLSFDVMQISSPSEQMRVTYALNRLYLESNLADLVTAQLDMEIQQTPVNLAAYANTSVALSGPGSSTNTSGTISGKPQIQPPQDPRSMLNDAKNDVQKQKSDITDSINSLTAELVKLYQNKQAVPLPPPTLPSPGQSSNFEAKVAQYLNDLNNRLAKVSDMANKAISATDGDAAKNQSEHQDEVRIANDKGFDMSGVTAGRVVLQSRFGVFVKCCV